MFAKQVEITGVVQGVGFRPFLFGLAKAHHLNGFVSNTARGVDLFIQGQKTDLDAFLQDVPDKKPLLSKISSIDIKDETVKDLAGFEIVKSRGAQTRSTLISPDVSICPDCLKEMLDPKDRRFEYPFINCTNCGPRYTIIRDIPYDRPKTSMAVFPMCSACQGEYGDPLDRRFHAQPNACPKCGPQVFLTDNKGTRIDSNDPSRAIELAASLLEKGKINSINIFIQVLAQDTGQSPGCTKGLKRIKPESKRFIFDIKAAKSHFFCKYRQRMKGGGSIVVYGLMKRFYPRCLFCTQRYRQLFFCWFLKNGI